jgi:hypothetical protein
MSIGPALASGASLAQPRMANDVIMYKAADTREATILPGIRCAPQNGEMMTRPALRRDIRDHDTKALPVSGR